uniref:Uncharacterized protein n=1 Tax=Arundo donax TaxID=35708 RepID=A0A0A9A6I1_ARUDO
MIRFVNNLCVCHCCLKYAVTTKLLNAIC